MSKQIISINEDYRIEVDHPNYTLQVSYLSKKDNEVKWRNEGFFSSASGAVRKFIELNAMNNKYMTLMEYANKMIASTEQAVAREIASVIASAKRNVER
jgi:hypothetical protein